MLTSFLDFHLVSPTHQITSSQKRCLHYSRWGKKGNNSVALAKQKKNLKPVGFAFSFYFSILNWFFFIERRAFDFSSFSLSLSVLPVLDLIWKMLLLFIPLGEFAKTNIGAYARLLTYISVVHVQVHWTWFCLLPIHKAQYWRLSWKFARYSSEFSKQIESNWIIC